MKCLRFSKWTNVGSERFVMRLGCYEPSFSTLCYYVVSKTSIYYTGADGNQNPSVYLILLLCPILCRDGKDSQGKTLNDFCQQLVM